jgi:hypothetical protein
MSALEIIGSLFIVFLLAPALVVSAVYSILWVLKRLIP